MYASVLWEQRMENRKWAAIAGRRGKGGGKGKVPPKVEQSLEPEQSVPRGKVNRKLINTLLGR